jgi:hypothetical protein
MKNYKKKYLDYFQFVGGEYVPCEVCCGNAVDIHHIDCRGMGGSDDKDYISNTMALCRDCHTKYGDRKEYTELLKNIHLGRLEQFHKGIPWL